MYSNPYLKNKVTKDRFSPLSLVHLNTYTVCPMPINKFILWFLILGICSLPVSSSGQVSFETVDSIQKGFLIPADSFNKKRFWTAAGIGITTYGATMIALNELWYADFPRSSFHFYNDWGEWNQMDKFGHAFSAYFEAEWAYKGARWTGLNEKRSIWVGTIVSTGIQSSIEFLDGFSDNWGWSHGDVAFNTLGTGLFTLQQLTWGEQRMRFKVSSFPPKSYDDIVSSNDGTSTVSLRDVAIQEFGKYPSSFLKDYNAMTIWLSINPRSFTPQSVWIPEWLNIAIGQGAGNIYGGFGNGWQYEGKSYSLSPQEYPRFRQWYLSLDVDLIRIKAKKPWVRTLLFLANSIKVPAPALEYRNTGKLVGHWLFF